MAGALVQRILEVTIKLATDSQTNQPNTFSESGSDTVTLKGSRTSVRVKNSGAPSGSTASGQIWGLTPSIMNQVATLGMTFNLVPRNTITIMAGDSAAGLVPVFAGTIVACYAEYDAAPDVPMHFECNSILADAVTPAAAASYTGSTDVATIMASFARLMGLSFENNGVSVKLASPYFSGNLRTQMRECAEHAGINAEVIGGQILAIWPKGGSRNTPTPPLIAPPPAGHMISYPAYTQQGIIVRTLFDPTITFGGLVKVQSSIKTVNDVGTWAVNQMDLALDSLVPKGKWEAVINAYNPKYPRPVVQQAGAS